MSFKEQIIELYYFFKYLNKSVILANSSLESEKNFLLNDNSFSHIQEKEYKDTNESVNLRHYKNVRGVSLDSYDLLKVKMRIRSGIRSFQRSYQRSK